MSTQKWSRLCLFVLSVLSWTASQMVMAQKALLNLFLSKLYGLGGGLCPPTQEPPHRHFLVLLMLSINLRGSWVFFPPLFFNQTWVGRDTRLLLQTQNVFKNIWYHCISITHLSEEALFSASLKCSINLCIFTILNFVYCQQENAWDTWGRVSNFCFLKNGL